LFDDDDVVLDDVLVVLNLVANFLKVGKDMSMVMSCS
jgi:hypothetical protein